jgi:DNA-3-methyladenine glycosylase
VTVARDLIGATLLVDGVGGRIVEVEAYDHDDPASHASAGETLRNRSMFGPPGHAYVYRSYGVHWLLNVVCGPSGHGAAVLIRAITPDRGVERIAARRPAVAPRDWCRGPGCVAVALAIGREHDGAALDQAPFALTARDRDVTVHATIRIGISRAVQRRWRFVEAGSRYLSGPAALRAATGPGDGTSLTRSSHHAGRDHPAGYPT